MSRVSASILAVLAVAQAIQAHTPIPTYVPTVEVRDDEIFTFNISLKLADLCPSQCKTPVDTVVDCFKDPELTCYCLPYFLVNLAACYDCVLDHDQTLGLTAEAAQVSLTDTYNFCVNKRGIHPNVPKLRHSNGTNDIVDPAASTSSSPEATQSTRNGAFGSSTVAYAVVLGSLGCAIAGLFI